MAVLSLDTVATVTGGTVVSGDPELELERFVIDSRHVRGGELFFALIGPHNDGHRFLQEAFQGGAAAAVVSRPRDLPGPAVKVADTTAALRALATHVRQRWGGTVIGITGSCGKTTTKEMLRLAVAGSRPALATRGNLNNLYGLPLMLLELEPDHEVAILEMGISTPGEMRPLARIALPDVMVFLNVEAVHLVHFSSVDEIATAKGEALEVMSPSGILVHNADDPRVARLAATYEGRKLSFGLAAEADVRAEVVQEESTGIQARLHTVDGDVPLNLSVAGRHNLLNALAAVAAAGAVGVSPAKAAARLAAFEPVAGRGERLQLQDDVSVWDESYNSNPAAMRAVLAALVPLQPRGRKVLVCGDMLELGPTAEQQHQELAPAIAAAGVQLFIAVGPLAAVTAEYLEQEQSVATQKCNTAKEAADSVQTQVSKGDLVLVKGSRSVGLEQVVDRLRQQRGGTAA